MNIWNPEVPRVVVILVLLVAGWVFIRYFEWKSLYYPAKELEATPDAIGLEYQDVQFISDDGHSLHGWWIPCTNARGTVIHCHGNAGNIGDRLWVAADLHRLGVNVFPVRLPWLRPEQGPHDGEGHLFGCASRLRSCAREIR